ncbi:hypothetical protein [Desulforamulus ferrireducens]|uniref:Uncharacterized protein n=1 Tax=Desulforamulus ferrireducens TaxID=1833852 RepID=A0A1S6IV18_9FIRM|nr:hypothetical protein [Desulforamulus ferrireducens]AQS58629.1 hypothetical protein B0537_05740 [Desulforamulus ferrireducens]
MSFDKQRFSELLGLAKGNRSINKYGRDADVDPGYISRLLRCLINKAPSADVILKLANKAYNGVKSTELMKAAGYLEPDSSDAYTEAMCQYDEVEQEILIAKESGLEIDYATAKRMVENRKRFLNQQKKPTHEEYVLSASTLADASLRIADLFKDYQIDEAEYLRLNKLAYRKFVLPTVPGAEFPKIKEP